MQLSSRRIRHLRLRAVHRELVQRGVTLVEDAFHTASLPWAETSRLYVVRRLPLGRIALGRSRTALPQTIRNRLCNLPAAAVHAESPAAAEHGVVYFHDAVEPYLGLASRLAAGEVPGEWFWPLAAPAWQPRMDRRNALRAVLGGALRTAAGPAAAVRMIHQLQRQTQLDALLETLGPADGRSLLRQFGWTIALHSAFEAPPPTPVHQPFSPDWQLTLCRWLGAWGPRDARSVWLAGVALVQRPVQLLQPDLVSRAERIAERFGFRASSGDPSPSDSSHADRVRHAEANRGVLDEPIRPGAAATASPGATGAGGPSPQAHPLADSSAFAPPQPPTGSERQPFGRSARRHAKRPAADPTDGIATPPAAGPPPQSPRPARGARIADSAIGHVPTPQEQAQPSGVVGEQPPAAPLPTEFGGMFFLVAAMAQLGISPFLQRHAPLIECDFPVRLLLELGRELNVPPDDPVLAVFEPPAGDVSLIGGVSAPPEWQSLWQDELHPPEFLRGALHGLDDVLCAWVAAVAMWCRAHADMELLEIIRRPGRIWWTPTHLDVLLDHRQADVRMRRAGLDLDPGWVPWLGRVVSFHYVYGEPWDV